MRFVHYRRTNGKWKNFPVKIYIFNIGKIQVKFKWDHEKHGNNTLTFFFYSQGDAGLTGRKIIVDTYGGWGAHGGGAFSGKDFTKVDRSAAYAARWVAKSLVKAKICRRCLVQVSYAIGVAEPISITVFDYGTSKRSQRDLLEIVKRNFDLRPGRIVKWVFSFISNTYKALCQLNKTLYFILNTESWICVNQSTNRQVATVILVVIASHGNKQRNWI